RTTRTPTRGVSKQPGDVGKSLGVGDAREVEIPAIGLRLAREGLLQVVLALRSLQALPAISNPPCDVCGVSDAVLRGPGATAADGARPARGPSCGSRRSARRTRCDGA